MFSNNKKYSEENLVREMLSFRNNLFRAIDEIIDSTESVSIGDLINGYKKIANNDQGSGQTTEELNLIMASMEEIPHDLLKSSKQFGNNNFNIQVQKNNTALVFQVGDQDIMVNEAIHLLQNDERMPTYFAKTYDIPILSKVYFPEKENAHNNFPRGKVVIGSFVERLPNSLVSKLNDLANYKNKTMLLEFTVKAGMQLCDILNDLNAHNVIWVDLKPGNLLLRSDNTIVIADKKAFYPKSKISLVKTTNKINATESFLPNLPKSPPYLSKQGEVILDSYPANNIQADEAREAVFLQWQKEYSYQLALVLYMLAANISEKDPAFEKIKENGFDFNYPIFKSTPEGQRFKKLLIALSDPDPDKRMTIDIASKELKILFDVLVSSQVMEKEDIKNQITSTVIGNLDYNFDYANKSWSNISSKLKDAIQEEILEALKSIMPTLTPTQTEIFLNSHLIDNIAGEYVRNEKAFDVNSGVGITASGFTSIFYDSLISNTKEFGLNANSLFSPLLGLFSSKSFIAMKDELKGDKESRKKQMALFLFEIVAKNANASQLDLLIEESKDLNSKGMKLLREDRSGHKVKYIDTSDYSDYSGYLAYLKKSNLKNTSIQMPK